MAHKYEGLPSGLQTAMPGTRPSGVSGSISCAQPIPRTTCLRPATRPFHRQDPAELVELLVGPNGDTAIFHATLHILCATSRRFRVLSTQVPVPDDSLHRFNVSDVAPSYFRAWLHWAHTNIVEPTIADPQSHRYRRTVRPRPATAR